MSGLGQSLAWNNVKESSLGWVGRAGAQGWSSLPARRGFGIAGAAGGAGTRVPSTSQVSPGARGEGSANFSFMNRDEGKAG